MTVSAISTHQLRVEDLAASHYYEQLVRLYDADSIATPFQHPNLLLIWWETVGRDESGLESLIVLGVDASDAVRWYVPLAIENTAPEGHPVVRYLGDLYADYHTLVCDPVLSRASATAAFRRFLRAGHWPTIRLSEWRCHDDSDGFAAPEWQLRPGTECPYLDLTDPQLVRGVLAKQEYAVKARRLDRLGGVGLRMLHGDEAVGAPLNDFVRMHRTQWEGEAAVGGFEDPAVERFFRGITECPALSQQVVLFVLTLDGTAIAYYFCFIKGAVCYDYRTSYDVTLRKLSPGALLLRAMVDLLAAEGFAEFDFMRGAYAYKKRFASGIRQNLSLISRPVDSAPEDVAP